VTFPATLPLAGPAFAARRLDHHRSTRLRRSRHHPAHRHRVPMAIHLKDNGRPMNVKLRQYTVDHRSTAAMFLARQVGT
jgi:hypothetical protein